jgi:hypothetical protein
VKADPNSPKEGVSSPEELAEEGMSTREIGDVLGVNQSTVVRDAFASEDEPESPEPRPESPEPDANASEPEPEQIPPEPEPTVMPVKTVPQKGDLILPPMPAAR